MESKKRPRRVGPERGSSGSRCEDHTAPPEAVNDDVPFGRFPQALVDDGIVAKLRRNDIAALFVLARHVDREWLAYPSPDTIAQRGGMAERTARRAVKRLADMGIIRIEPMKWIADGEMVPIAKAGGVGTFNAYRLVANMVNSLTTFPDRNPVTKVTTFDQPNPVKPVTTFPGPNLVNSDPEPGQNAPGKGVIGLTPKQLIEQPKEEQQPQAAAGPAAAADQSVGTGGLRDELRRHGIGNPTLDELVAVFADATPAMVQQALADSTTGTGSGLKVVRLRERLPGLIEAERLRPQREAAERAEADRIEAEQDAERQRVERVRQAQAAAAAKLAADTQSAKAFLETQPLERVEWERDKYLGTLRSNVTREMLTKKPDTEMILALAKALGWTAPGSDSTVASDNGKAATEPVAGSDWTGRRDVSSLAPSSPADAEATT